MQESMIGQNIIITEPCKNLRALGRNALRGYWKIGILAVLVYTVCVSLPYSIMNTLFGYNPMSYLVQDGYTYDMDIDIYNSLYNSMPQSSILGSLYIIIVAGPFTLGICMFFLGIFRKQGVKVKDVFLGFEQFPKALGLLLYQTLFIVLWTFLFIVPGIIAAIRYSQAFYVLADDPTKSITQCMNESKAMMQGNKAKYFLLILSFIGWSILSSVPASLFQEIFIHATSNEVVLTLAFFVSSLFMIPVQVYIYSTEVGFYEILAGHLIKETQPAPVTPALQAAVEESAARMEEEKKAEAKALAAPVGTAVEEAATEVSEAADAAAQSAEGAVQTAGETVQTAEGAVQSAQEAAQEVTQATGEAAENSSSFNVKEMVEAPEQPVETPEEKGNPNE